MRISVLLLLPFAVPVGAFAESAAGVRWTAPSGWTTDAAAPMRAATYTVGPSAGDSARAECAVYYFGEGQGGTVEANVERWTGQFRDAKNQPASAKVAKRTSHGLTITTVDVSGTYSGMGGPMARERAAVSGYRLLGAIVEAPRGHVFIKFTGPEKTIAANQSKFEQLIASFQPEK